MTTDAIAVKKDISVKEVDPAEIREIIGRSNNRYRTLRPSKNSALKNNKKEQLKGESYAVL